MRLLTGVCIGIVVAAMLSSLPTEARRPGFGPCGDSLLAYIGGADSVKLYRGGASYLVVAGDSALTYRPGYTARIVEDR